MKNDDNGPFQNSSVEQNDATPNNILTNLAIDKYIPNESFGVWMTFDATTGGQLSLGGYDSSKFTGNLVELPTVTTGNANGTWSVAFDQVQVGNYRIPMSSSPVLVAPGAPIIGLPLSVADQLNRYLGANSFAPGNREVPLCS